MLDLRIATPPSWLTVVFADFDAFIVDHAACERKASATGMSLVVKYPDKSQLIEPLIEFSREELEHFHVMYRVLARRGLRLADDYRDAYVNGLRSQMRSSADELLLDRLLIAGIVEARGCERLHMVAQALTDEDPDLKNVYMDLARAESRHHALFFRLARLYYAEREVSERAGRLLDFEAELVARLPHQPRVH
jgi:tRNA 2-(methylsulfanyl)-N6-isopentenyladenosine37 hydroxylase